MFSSKLDDVLLHKEYTEDKHSSAAVITVTHERNLTRHDKFSASLELIVFHKHQTQCWPHRRLQKASCRPFLPRGTKNYPVYREVL